MNKLNEYFSRGEFACKCGCEFSVVDTELLEVLTRLRLRFNQPVKINSACRCAFHNKAVGGSDGSKHKLGIAADVVVKGVPTKDVYNFLDCNEPNKYGIGEYKTFVHIDVRENKARW
ncbi:MAG TPA: serine/threonine protein kinase [Methylococcaceae bacterium]|nr:serine/threonine protein kinase [Methylococcaceae bacterium]